MCGDSKKPRLFYWEEGIDAWIPAPEKVENLLDISSFCDDEEVIEIKFKRIDMTDSEFDNLTED